MSGHGTARVPRRASCVVSYGASSAPLWPRQLRGDPHSCNHDYMATQREGAAVDTPAEIRGWCLGRLPDGWFSGPPEVIVDREEITVIGQLPPSAEGEPGPAGEEG